jgi:hypothetical protein
MKLLGKKPTIDHDPNEFGQKPVRFWLMRRMVMFVLCLAMIGVGGWLIRPSLWGYDQWPSGWAMLVAGGLIGTGIGILWTDYIELSDT